MINALKMNEMLDMLLCLLFFRVMFIWLSVLPDSGVFAVPLSKAVAQIQAENNTEEEKASKSKTSKAKSVGDEQDGDVEERLRMRRHSSSSLHQSIHNTVEPPPKKNTTPNKSSNDSPKWKSRLIDALSLVSSPASASCLGDKQSDCAPVPPQVPLIVQKAIEHLEHYGECESNLHTQHSISNRWLW